jgi:hypothetical protein
MCIPFQKRAAFVRKGGEQMTEVVTWSALLQFLTVAVRTCIHNRGMPDGRGFFPSDKEIFRSHTDVWQGKPTQYGGKKTSQTVCSGCEYRF